MISRRNFITITMLMVSVLFLCMSINHLKDSLSDYAVNHYTETAENYPSKINIYVPDSFLTGNATDSVSDGDGEKTTVPRNMVVYIGEENGMFMKAAVDWVVYTKRNIVAYPSLSAYESAGDVGEPPEMMVLDPEYVDWSADDDLDYLDKCLENGTSLVFCGLPDVSVIENSNRIREFLGIQSVLAEENTVSGFYLREGFLLGGSAFYPDRTDSDEALTDNDVFPGRRTFPWYLPASGTKVYMKGVPGDNAVDEGEYPIAIWRNSRKNAFVFAVNGRWMEGQMGIGLLSAMSAEMHSYELYPVVNAQSVILAGYPGLANENPETMERLYNSSVRRLHQEVMWPGISNLLQKYRYRATCMMAPQYDYSDDCLPDGEQLEYCLKIFEEQSVETGLYALSVSDTPLKEKLEADGQFFWDAMGGYRIASFYAGGLEDGQIVEMLDADVLTYAKTVVRDYDEAIAGPVDFLSEDVTSQTALNGIEYTCQSDFLVRCMETSLGYFNMSFDLSRAVYPDDDGKDWTDMSIVMASTVDACGQRYPVFARTTATESDARIRQFLTLDYSQSRTGNLIEIEMENSSGPVWFILRTHGEAIRAIDGGNFEELEAGACLIEVTGDNAILTLGPADERHYQ